MIEAEHAEGPRGAADSESPVTPALPALLESLLFVSPSPVSVARLAQAAGISVEDAEAALAELAQQLGDGSRGLRLQRKDDRVTLTTAAEHTPYIEKLLGLDPSARLSQAAMETLAVIAYRQPLTRPQIEAVRGVNCDGVLRTLLARELVEAVGRLEQPGRPFLYGTTFQFLQYFGLTSLSDLPMLPQSALTTETGT
jgi:segregation and condensation protein B